MIRHTGYLLCAAVFLISGPLRADVIPKPFALERLSREIKGRVLDFTKNHSGDRRNYFPSLCKKRDMYVYLPPCYDPTKQYPMAIFLHGFLSDEATFVDEVVRPFDRAMACGKLPPMIIAAPDASVSDHRLLASYGTFYCNTNLGRYEDFLVCDVYEWMLKNFPIRPEPGAHVLLGVSMGGHGAFSKCFKHPDKFRVAVALLSPLNMLYTSCRNRYMDRFDPCCWKQREHNGSPYEIIGRFYAGIIVTQGHIIHPMYGRNNPKTIELMKQDNPFDLLESRDVQPGQFELFVGYAGKDEFNLAAQAESFLHRAAERKIPVTTRYFPDGHHNTATGRKMLPEVIEWLNEKLTNYHPCAAR